MVTDSKKIKVLFVITKSNFGGAQKYVFDLATRLPADRFDVAVALGGDGLLVSKLHEANIHTIQIPSLLRDVDMMNDLSAFFGLRAIFRKEQPDVVHLNSAKAGGVGALAARLDGVPKIIFTAHGWAFNEERSLVERIFITFFSWVTVLLAHQTIAVSRAVKNDTRNWPFVQGKIATIQNGATTPPFYSPDEARAKLSTQIGATFPENAYILGTIAELHKNKGLAYAIEALATLIPQNPSLYYIILGGGEGKERLEALVRLHNLQERVFLPGFVKDAAAFLPAFDAFILPSIKEGLPYVALEAGLAKLPVIATNIGGIPEIIEDRKTGLIISPRDIEAIAHAVRELRGDSVLAKNLGEALYKKTMTEFSLERVLRETASIYTKN